MKTKKQWKEILRDHIHPKPPRGEAEEYILFAYNPKSNILISNDFFKIIIFADSDSYQLRVYLPDETKEWSGSTKEEVLDYLAGIFIKIDQFANEWIDIFFQRKD